MIFFSMTFVSLKANAAEETCNGHLTAIKIYDQATDAPVPGVPPVWVEINGNSPTTGPDIDIDLLPANYYLVAEVSGNITSASIFVNSVGQSCENTAPYTYPAGAETGSNWNAGLGTYSLDFNLYHIDGCNSEVCDGVWNYSFSIVETPDDCGSAPAVCTEPCTRVASDTDNCNTGIPYQAYLVDCCGVGRRLTTTSSTWEDCEDGAIHFTGTFEWIGSGCDADAYDVLTFDVTYFGATTTPPANSPKDHSCETADPTGWVYYPEMCGTMVSAEHGTFDLSPTGPSFQVGNGANVTGTLDFGASGWIHVSGGDGHYTNGDFNIMLGGLDCPDPVIPPSEPTCTGCYTYENTTQEKLINGDQFTLALPQAQFGGAVEVNVVEAISWDGYPSRVNADQPHEQWKLVFLKNGAVVGESAYTVDLQDFVASAEEISNLGTVSLPDGADQLLIVSYENATYGEGDQATANSVVPSSFCLVCTPMEGTVSGHVYEDTNGNGVQDPGEPNLVGVEVVVTDSNGNTQTVFTDGNGDYIATVPPGSTEIEVIGVPGTQTEGTNPTTVIAVAEEDTFSDNDGFYTPGSVSGHLYIDTNGNGVQDAGEPNLAFVDIEITDSNGNTQIVETDAIGNWSALVPPGTTTADILEGDPQYPTGYEQTEGTDPTTVTAVAGSDTFTDNDGFYQPATVSGHLFIDTDGDGVQGPNEPDLANVDVIITDSEGNTQVVSTGPDGDWSATVPPGSTTALVDETDPDFPENHVQTAGTNPTTVTAVGGEDTFTDNDGYYESAEVFGHIYIDDNKNGVQDPGEPNVANLDVVITDSNGNMQTVTTNAAGDWVAIVPPGTTTADIDENDPQFPTGLSQSEGEDPTMSFAIAGESVDGGTDGYADCPAAPSANLEFEQYLCQGESVVFEVADPIQFATYMWDFGPVAEPSTYVGTGPIEVFYNTPTTAGADVLLIVEAQNCPAKNSIVAVARVTPVLDETTIMTDDQVCADLTKTFEAGNTVPIGIYEWDFGPGATPQTAFGAGPHDVIFADGGAQEVNLTATPDYQDPFKVCPHVETYMFTADDCVGTVRGNVSDTDGNALEGVLITLDDGDPATTDLTTTTDANGDYEFLYIPVGTYTIVQTQPANYGSVSDEDGTPDDPALGDNDGVTNNEIPVKVNPDEFDEDNDFVETADGGSVSGNVSDIDGEPLSGVVVTLVDGDPATTDPITATNADGDYSFSNVEPGTYTLVQTQPANYTSVSDEDGTPEDPTVGDNDGVVNEEIPVKVDPGEDDEDNDFVESPDPGSVSGTVTDNTGAPIEGVLLTLDDGNPATTDLTATTDANGEYEFPVVPTGTYTVVETQPADYTSISDEDATPEDPSVWDNDGLINEEIPVKVEPGEDDEDNNFIESPDPGSVSGTVTDVDGNPIGGVTLTLDDGDPATMDMTTTSNPDGTYEFPVVPAGIYTIVEEQPADYTSVSDEDSSPEDPSIGDNDGITNDEIPVKVEAGEADAGNDFVEEPIPGSVTGTVTDNFGNPIEGVVLTLDDGDAATTDPTATTLADGTYEFPNVPAGTYTIVETQPADYSSVSDEDTSPEDPAIGDNDGITNDEIPVKVDAGEIDADNDFVETADPGSVSGTVTDVDGNPLEGVVLTLDDGNPATTDPTATTLADGSYEFLNVPVGTYVVTEEQPADYTSVSDEDTTPEDPSIGDDDGIVNEAIPVKVEPGEADDNNDFVEEPNPGSVSGTVTDDTGAPIEGVVITLVDGDPATPDPTTTTLADGTYEFPIVPAGTYTLVETQPADYASVSDEDTTPEDPSIGDNDGVTNEEIPVKVEPGEADENNDFVETANAGSVSGSVTDTDGNPIEGVLITLDDGDAATTDLTTTTLADGTYEFPVVPAGTYTLLETQPADYLSVSDEDATPEDPIIGDADGITNDAIPVKVDAGEADDDNNFIEEVVATLIGHVYYDNNNNNMQDPGEPDLEGIPVSVMQSDGSTINLVTDEFGNYETVILPGLTQVDIDNTDPQIAGATQTEGMDPQILTSLAATVNDAGNDGYYLPGNIFGNVSTEGGDPIADVVITLDDGDPATTDLTTTTNADGDYEFLGVNPGTYTIVETQPATYTSVSDEDATPEDPIVGDADGITNDEIPVKLNPGEDDEDNDFIENLTAIFGHVYYDVNNNGTQDLGEPDIPNVTVTVQQSDGSFVTTETDANGDWETGVLPGLTSAEVDETDPDFLAVVGSEFQQTEGTNPNNTAVLQGTVEDGGIDGYSGVPDITPIITFIPTNVTGVSDLFFTIRTQELINTPRLTFTYNQGLTSSPIGPLQNPDWTYDGSNASFHQWTSTTTIDALDASTLGFFATYDPEMSTGEVTFTVTIVAGSGTENNFDNNIDAETLDYFSGAN